MYNTDITIGCQQLDRIGGKHEQNKTMDFLIYTSHDTIGVKHQQNQSANLGSFRQYPNILGKRFEVVRPEQHKRIGIQHEQNKTINILIYNYSPDWMDDQMLDHCPANCRFVKHDQIQIMSKYEYILFLGPTLNGIPEKITGQTWIYYSMEPPPLSPRLRNCNVIHLSVLYQYLPLCL